MKKPILLILGFLLITLEGFAQTSPPILPLSNCLVNEETGITNIRAAGTYIEGFVLVDPVTDIDIRELKNGDIIYTGTPYNIRVDAVNAASVRISWGNNLKRLENYPPFSLAGDNNGDYASWSPQTGVYTLSAIPYTERFGKGIQGPLQSIQITVMNPPAVRFFLVNADTDKDIQEIREGLSIDLGQLPTDHLNIRADIAWDQTESVKFGFLGKSSFRTENVSPYALHGDIDGNYNSWTPSTGNYMLSATAFSEDAALGMQGSSGTIHFSFVRVRFVLVNADTDKDILEIEEGMSIDLDQLPTDHLNISVDIPWDQTESVKFGFLGKSSFRTENVSPYALYGDIDSNYNSWTPSTGNYTLSATAFSEDAASGMQGPSSTIHFSLIRSGTATTSYVELNNLVVLYKNTNIGPLDPNIRKLMEDVLENTSMFYWRHSHMKLAINWTIIEVDTYRDIVRENGYIYPHVVDQDLQNMGYSPSYSPQEGGFDAVYAVANGSGNYAWGAYRTLGRAGFFQTAFWTEDYNFWVAVHEFHHIIDDMFYRSGHPSYPHNHPGAARVQGEFVPNSGPDWDLNWKIIQYWDKNDWQALANQGVWGRIKTTTDTDEDGIPNNDPSVPLDEVRFGSNAVNVDTDNDGLPDLKEAMSGIFSGTNPKNPDTDGDGRGDAEDSEPLYPFDTTIPFRASFNIVSPVSSWPLAGNYYFRQPDASLYLAYNSGHLYVGLTLPTSFSSSVHVFIDANNDGLFHGNDNLEIILNANSINNVFLYDASAVPAGDYADFYVSNIPVQGFSGVTETRADFTSYKLDIPQLAPYGLNLVSGEQFGLRVVVDNYGSMLETDDYMTLSLGNGATWAARQAGSFAGEPFGISFYPNPVQRYATVSWEPSFNPTTMRVTDAMGKLMRASRIMSQGTMSFETGMFPSGVYSIQLIGKEGIKTIRFVKE